ncbi:MAG: hypothetical protein FH749_09625 [Firmicutes bacterium]|nr:hypothetical protein [Bacillota bacterium]
MFSKLFRYEVKLNLVIIVVVFMVYLFNQLVLKQLTWHFFVHWYINDILAAPLLLGYSNILLALSPYKLRIAGLGPVLLFMLVVGLFWEVVTPLYKPTSVGDPWDLVAYLTGGGIYLIAFRALSRTQLFLERVIYRHSGVKEGV